MDLGSREVQELQPEPPILMVNGATPYGGSKVLVTSQVSSLGSNLLGGWLCGRRQAAGGRRQAVASIQQAVRTRSGLKLA